MGARGHNTIYRDLIYSGQGVRGEKTNSKRFDITWVGGQNTIDRGWLDIPWVGWSISSRANVGKIYIYVHHEKYV
jgi:hypothetical protein